MSPPMFPTNPTKLHSEDELTLTAAQSPSASFQDRSNSAPHHAAVARERARHHGERDFRRAAPEASDAPRGRDADATTPPADAELARPATAAVHAANGHPRAAVAQAVCAVASPSPRGRDVHASTRIPRAAVGDWWPARGALDHLPSRHVVSGRSPSTLRHDRGPARRRHSLPGRVRRVARRVVDAGQTHRLCGLRRQHAAPARQSRGVGPAERHAAERHGPADPGARAPANARADGPPPRRRKSPAHAGNAAHGRHHDRATAAPSPEHQAGVPHGDVQTGV